MVEEYERIKECRGPKNQFKIFLSITVIICFLFGLSLMRTESGPTGYVVSGVNVLNLLGFLFLMIGIIFAFLWLKKPKR